MTSFLLIRIPIARPIRNLSRTWSPVVPPWNRVRISRQIFAELRADEIFVVEMSLPVEKRGLEHGHTPQTPQRRCELLNEALLRRSPRFELLVQLVAQGFELIGVLDCEDHLLRRQAVLQRIAAARSLAGLRPRPGAFRGVDPVAPDLCFGCQVFPQLKGSLGKRPRPFEVKA